MKPKGAPLKYDTQVAQVLGGALSQTLTMLGMSGYVVTGMVLNGAGYTVVGARPSGATATYDTTVIRAAV